MSTRLNYAVSFMLMLVPVATVAQDGPMPTIDYNGTLNDARVTGRMVRQAQQRQRRYSVTTRASQRQAAACANKQGFRREYGAGHPKVRRLYALCRSVGL